MARSNSATKRLTSVFPNELCLKVRTRFSRQFQIILQTHFFFLSALCGKLQGRTVLQADQFIMAQCRLILNINQKKSHTMQRSLRKRLGLINKIFHRATAKQCGPARPAVSVGRLSPSPINLMLSQEPCERSGRPLPGSHVQSSSSTKRGFKGQSFLFFLFLFFSKI